MRLFIRNSRSTRLSRAAQAFVEERTLEGIRLAQRDFEDPVNLRRLARYHVDKATWVVTAWIETWLSPGFADWNLAATLAAVHCPVLAVHGEHDEYGSIDHPSRIAAGTATGQGLPISCPRPAMCRIATRKHCWSR